VKEQAVAAQAVTQAPNGRVGDAALASDLAQAGAGDEAVEDPIEEVRAPQPVGCGKGL